MARSIPPVVIVPSPSSSNMTASWSGGSQAVVGSSPGAAASTVSGNTRSADADINKVIDDVDTSLKSFVDETYRLAYGNKWSTNFDTSAERSTSPPEVGRQRQPGPAQHFEAGLVLLSFAQQGRPLPSSPTPPSSPLSLKRSRSELDSVSDDGDDFDELETEDEAGVPASPSPSRPASPPSPIRRLRLVLGPRSKPKRARKADDVDQAAARALAKVEEDDPDYGQAKSKRKGKTAGKAAPTRKTVKTRK